MTPTPAELIRLAVDASNRQDMDAFLRLFAEDAEVRSAWDQAFRGDFVHRGHDCVRAWAAEAWENVNVEVEVESLLEHGASALLLGNLRTLGRTGGTALRREFGAFVRVERGKIAVYEGHLGHGDALIAFGRHVRSLPARASMGSAVGNAVAPGATPFDVANLALEAFNQGDLEGFVGLFHEQAEIRSVLDRALRGEFTHRGHDGVRAWVTDVWENFDIRTTYRAGLRCGPLALFLGSVQTRAHSAGTPLDQPYGAVSRVEDGRILLFESYFDHADAAAAFGEQLRSVTVANPAEDIAAFEWR